MSLPERALPERASTALKRRWLVVVAGAVALLHAYPIYRLLARLPPRRFPPHSHTIIFEYVGWFLSAGGRLYVDIWAIKPPLAHLLPTAVAALSGGDMFRYHYALVVLTALASTGGVVAIALLAYRLTGSRAAAVAGATVPLTDPNYLWRPALGFEPKYLVLLFGLLSIYFVLEDRPFPAGVTSAVAAGLWQLAVVFPLVVLVEFGRRDRRIPRRALAGMGAVTAVAVLPVLYWGAMPAMLSEVLLTTLLASNESGGVLYGFSLLHGWLTRTLVAAGLLGFPLLVYREGWDRWVLPAVALWFLAQLTLIDADGFPDTFVLLGMAGVGFGLLVGSLPETRVPWRGVLVAALLGGVLWTHAGGWGFAEYYFRGRVARPQPLRPPINPGELEYAFWLQKRVETCRFFGGETQREIVERFGGSMTAERCGRYFWPMLRALLPAY